MRRLLIPLIAILFAAIPLHAAQIGLVGENSNAAITTLLTAHGHSVVDNPGSYAGLDAVILLRNDGSTALANFVNGGGCLITEWSAVDWTLNTAGLLDADATYFGSTSPMITFTPAGISSGLANGVTNPYSDSPRTEYFYNLINIGADVDVLATRTGDLPVIIGGSYGAGRVTVIAYDWADSFQDANADTRQLILNAVNLCGEAVFEPLPADVPALDARGFAALAVLLAAAAIALLRH